MQQPPYGQPPYGQPYAQPPGYGAPMTGGAPMGDKPVDPVRMIIGVIGCGLLTISTLYSLASDGPKSKFMAFFWGVIEVAAYLGLAAGLSGLRTTLGMVAAGANALLGLCLLGLTGLWIIEVHSLFLFKLSMFAVAGSTVLAFVGTAAALATAHKKIGPAVFAGAGLFGVSSLVALYFVYRAVMFLVDDRMEGAKTATSIGHYAQLFAGLATAAAFVIGMMRAKKTG